MSMRMPPTILVLVFALLSPSGARSGDWPQILGPNRDGKAVGERLLEKWPSDGPKMIWQRPVGSGFAGVAVVQGRMILFHRVDDEELVECLDARSGKSIWKQSFAATYIPQISEDNGPRCVPIIQENRVFVYGAAGDLHCVAFDSGKKIWSRPARKQLRAQDGYFGAGSSPLIVDDKILVNIGAKPNASIVAYSIRSGKPIWKSVDDFASYSSPILIRRDGKKLGVFLTRLKLVLLDPSNGNVLSETPFGARGPTVNAANPTLVNDNIFVTASYRIGAVFAKLEGSRINPIWKNDNIMSSQYTTSVEDSGNLFGIHGRQDIGTAQLRCISPESQRIRWTESGFGMATLILADGKLLIMKTSGELVLAKADPSRFTQLDSARLMNSTTRALPALSNGLLCVRDTRTLKCFQVGTIND